MAEPAKGIARIFRRSGAALAILLMIGPGATGVAQETGQTESPQQKQQPQPLRFEEEIQVTGSLIPRPTLEALSPVTVLEPEDVAGTGITRVEDLLQTLPQVFTAQNSTITNGATGTATVDLRRLGVNRTLVLVDGRRAPTAIAGFTGQTAADLNFIPAALVKRIDVLSGGASSVYGADAVAGVVNFVMDREFEGFRGGIQYSIFQHDNDNDLAQRINTDAGNDYPSGSVWDGGAVDAYAAYGGRFADGRGHATAWVEYRKTSALRKDRRDYTNCSVSILSASGPQCGGSPTTSTTSFMDVNYNAWTLDTSGPGNTFREFVWPDDLFNYAPDNFMQRPDVRWTAGAYVDYGWNEHFQGYLDIMLMDDVTDAEIAPSGDFFSPTYVNCDNPLLSQDEYEKICLAQGYGPEDDAYIEIGRRNVEGGSRSSHLEHTAYRLVAGLRGDIDDTWSYDLYGLHSQVRNPESYQGELSTENIQNALLVISDPVTGEPVCRDAAARANGCVPWNIWETGGVTQAAVDYLTIPALYISGSKTQVASVKLNGDLETYGWKLPAASEGVKLALGAEYRKEELFYNPDLTYRDAIGAGQGAELLPVSGDYDVKEGFAELLVPLIQDVPGARDLTLELGYRYSDYSTTGGAGTWKAQASYAPVAGYKVRVGYSRATRSPNVAELFQPQALYFLGLGADPCANDIDTGAPTATLEECAHTGVSPEQYGHIRPGGGNSLYGGNPDLDQETGDTRYAGIVITPPGLPGFTAALDYFHIRMKGTIGYLDPNVTMTVCLRTGDPRVCDLIHRDANGSLAYSPEGYIDMVDRNIGSLTSEGVDVNLSSIVSLGEAGFLNLNLIGTYLLESSVDQSGIAYDCAGYFGNTCHEPASRWRHRASVSWESGFDTVLTLRWRMIGPATNDVASPDPDLANPDDVDAFEASGSLELPAYSFFDLTATYDLTRNVQLTLGVNNILDKEPPLGAGLVDVDYGPGFYGAYDPWGRFVHANLLFTF